MRYCEHCGGKLDNNATFCQNCGAKIEVKEVVNGTIINNNQNNGNQQLVNKVNELLNQ